jgi:hypothetical protein
VRDVPPEQAGAALAYAGHPPAVWMQDGKQLAAPTQAVEVIALTSVAANLTAVLGGILVFDEPIGSRPLEIAAASWPSASSSPAARADHQVRQPTRPSPARRSRLALPPTPPRAGRLARRQTGGEPHVLALSWQAQRRLHAWNRMEQRSKRRTVIAVAAARELAGFCWAVATAD